jgi:hypothetical protein
MPELIGPKPEPVPEPIAPTPWETDGAYVYDAHGRRILMVDGAALSGAQDDGIARLIVEAINEKYGVSVKTHRYFRQEFTFSEPTFYEFVDDVHTRTLGYVRTGWETPRYGGFTLAEMLEHPETEEVPRDQVPGL